MKKTKQQVQEEAVSAFVENNSWGMILMATGTGKSKVAIDYIKKYNPLLKSILIVVPTQKLRDVGWKNEFEKWDALEIMDAKVEKSCYASISKLKGNEYDLVVMDEAHNITVNNSVFFQDNKVHRLMALTATLPQDFIKSGIISDTLKLKPVYTVTIDEAVKWGLVSPYKITVVYTKLNAGAKYINLGEKKRPLWYTELGAYTKLTSTIQNIKAKEDKLPKDYARLEMLYRKRMRIIYDLKSKGAVAQALLKHEILPEHRTIIFCGSIAQADMLSPYRFHSKTDSTGFDLFYQEKVNQLSCVNAINEGHNLPNVDNALIVQLNSKELNLVQRLGRIIRYRDGHIGNIFIIVVKGTVDENWFRNATAGLDQDNIEEIDFATLKMTYET